MALSRRELRKCGCFTLGNSINGRQQVVLTLRRCPSLDPTLRATAAGPDEFPRYPRLPRYSGLSLPCVLWILNAELLSVAVSPAAPVPLRVFVRLVWKFSPSWVPRFWILSLRVVWFTWEIQGICLVLRKVEATETPRSARLHDVASE